MQPTPAISWADPARQAAFHAWFTPLAEQQQLDATTLAPASADASFRRYFRVQGRPGGAWASAIVMDAPPPLEDVRPFVDIAARIGAAGLHGPQLLAADAQQGFLLLSDLGASTYLPVLQAAVAAADAAGIQRLMRNALAALRQWQRQVDAQGLPAYDAALLQRELALFPEWCVAREHGVVWTEAQQSKWQGICERLVASALDQPRVAVHRDWMPRNLMVASAPGAPEPGILDFQDAVLGPVTYDIASLLRDAFISWDEPQELDWAVRWWQGARADGLLAGHRFEDDFGDCWRAIEWMGLQRHLKVLGIFCRLKHRDGKPAYSADLPRFFAYATRVVLRYRELAPLLPLLEQLAGPLTRDGFSLR